MVKSSFIIIYYYYLAIHIKYKNTNNVYEKDKTLKNINYINTYIWIGKQ